MNTLLQDGRYALRGFRKNPAFAVVAVLSLGLGIGANTAIFSLMDRVLLRSLPVERPGELVLLTAKGPRSGNVETSYDSDYTFSYPMYCDFRDRAPVFNGVLAWYRTQASFAVAGGTDLVRINLVTGNFFEMLGVKTVLGRPIGPQDDRTPGSSPVAVLSHGFWVRRFGANPGILNQTVNVNNHLLTVIGVAQPGFQGLAVGESPELFVPVMMESQMMPGRSELAKRRSMWLNVIARLKPGVSKASAEAAMNVFWRPILQDELKDLKQPTASTAQRFVNRHLSLVSAANGISGLRLMFQTPLRVLMALVGVVLLIACANVANLMIARAAGRRKEMAIRLALGAGRRDIVRQILVESVALALAGGAVGLLLAMWTGGVLLHLLPFGSLVSGIATEPDLRVLAFTAAVSIVSGIFFGLAPALQTTRPDLASTLKDQAANVSGGAAQVIYRKALVIVQVALSLMLLIGAGLFLRSLHNLREIDPGFRADHLVSFSIDPSLNGYDSPRAISLFDRLSSSVQALPGVHAAAVSETPLLTGDNNLSSIEVPGREPKESDATPNFDLVNPGFFSAMGIPLVAGREFSAGDGSSAPRVAIVNDTFARAYFGNENALGRHFNFAGDKSKPQIEIVGIVKTGKYTDLREEKQAFVFCPYSQRYRDGAMTFYVRTSQEPETLTSALRHAVREADANLPVADVKTMEQQIDESVFADRIVSGLSAFFGLLATVLAAIGLYGVISYSVSRRTAEIGIRVALGANQRMVLGLVLREGLALIFIGVLCGSAAAFAVSRLIANLLYQVRPNDPVTFAAFTAMLIAVAFLAIYIPARRAARLDPVIALRSE